MLLWVFSPVKFWGESQQLKGMRNTVEILILAVLGDKTPNEAISKGWHRLEESVLIQHFFSLTGKSLNNFEGEGKRGDWEKRYCFGVWVFPPCHTCTVLLLLHASEETEQ